MGIRARYGLANGVLNSPGPSDTTRPTVVITLSDETTPTYTASVTVTITFSEVVTGFVVGDITVGGGGALADFAGSGDTYTVTWTFANGINTLDIAEGVCVDGAGNTNTAATQKSIRYVSFVLRDDFTDTVAAGAVNGTSATPTGGARVATDANSKISIGSGLLSVATGAALNSGLWYSQQARGAGKATFTQINITSNLATSINTGWFFNQGNNAQNTVQFFNNGTLSIVDGGNARTVGVYSTSVNYNVCSVLRAAGGFNLIKGGAFANWTLLYPAVLGSGNDYPGMVQTSNTTAVFSLDLIRYPTDTIVITPLASDAFTRDDGVLGNTGGGGSAESGGSGLAWVDQVGTWAIATNKATCSAPSGGVGIATVPCGTINAIVECAVTRSGGNAGIVLRYAGASDYVIAYHDGTNAHLDKVTTAGGTTSLINTAATYSAGARIMVVADATKFRLYYNNALVGTEQTIADATLQTGQAHGLYTTDAGNTLDNFVVWARGNGGEYATLDNYINP